MALVSDRCICLRKTEYSETSQILLLMARAHGLVRTIAKGAHRRTKAGASKFDGGIDLLDVGDAVFTDSAERELATLTEWHLAEGHLELRRSLRGTYLATYAAELVSLLIEERDAHPELFDRLEQTLAELSGPRAEEMFLAFELDLLRQTGYLPELGECVECGRGFDGSEMWFSALRGGVVCRSCTASNIDSHPVDSRLLRMVQSIERLPREPSGEPTRLPRLTRHQSDPVNRLLAEHIQHTLGRRLKLTRYVLP